MLLIDPHSHVPPIGPPPSSKDSRLNDQVGLGCSVECPCRVKNGRSWKNSNRGEWSVQRRRETRDGWFSVVCSKVMCVELRAALETGVFRLPP